MASRWKPCELVTKQQKSSN